MRYTYSMLIEDLLLGHDFEFNYKGKTYGIITSYKGKILCVDNKAISPYFEDVVELLSKVKIDNKNLEEVFNESDKFYIL